MEDTLKSTSLRAVVIGNNATSRADWNTLSWAEEDAGRINKMLGEVLRCPSEAIDLYYGRRRPVYNRVRDNIRSVLQVQERPQRRWTRSKTPDDEYYDLALIYFSGHAMPLSESDIYLVLDNTTRDQANALKISEIHAWMEESPVRYIVLILDCCYSGVAATPSRSNYVKSALGRIFQTQRPLPQGFGRAVLASSWHDEVSVAHGVIGGTKFTHYLIEGLSGKDPPAMHSAFKQVDAATLYSYVNSRPNMHQHPELYVWGTSPVLLEKRSEMTRIPEPPMKPQVKQLWTTRSGQFLSEITALDLSSDGEWVVLGFADGSLRLVSASDGKDTRDIYEPSKSERPTHLVVSPDSKQLAVVRRSAADYSISLKALTGEYQEQRLGKSQTRIERVRFHPESGLVAMCTEQGDFQIWTSDGDLHWRLDTNDTQNKHINDFAFCYPAGKQVAVALEGNNGVSLWDIYEKRVEPQTVNKSRILTRQDWEHIDTPTHIVAVPREESNTAIVSCTTRLGHVFVWNLSRGSDVAEVAEIAKIGFVPTAFALSPDAKAIACGTVSGEVHVMRPEQPESSRRVKKASAAAISALAFSPTPNGHQIAVGAIDGYAGLLNYETFEDMLPSRKSVPGTTLLRFSDRGLRLLVAGIETGILEMWQIDWSQ